MNDILAKLLQISPPQLSGLDTYPPPLKLPPEDNYVRRLEGDPVAGDFSKPQGPARPAPQVQAPVLAPQPVAPQTPAPNIQDILSKVTAKSPEDTELKNQQANARDLVGMLLMTRGANKIGNSIAGVKPDANYNQGAIDLVNKKTTDLKDQRDSEAKLEDQNFQRRNQAIGEVKAEYDLKRATFEQGDREKENDPNSELSIAFRDYARSFIRQAGANVVIPDNLSYADLNKQMGMLGNMVSAKMARDSAALQRDLLKKSATDEKLQKKLDSEREKLIKYVDFQRASLRTNIGSLQKRLNTSENLKALLGSKPGDLTSPELRELVTGVNSMLGGSNAVSQIDHLDYPSAKRKFAEILTYATGEPVSANSPGIEERLRKLLEREEEVLHKQLLNSINLAPQTAPNLQKHDPDMYNSIVDSVKTPYVEEKYTSAQEAGITALMKANPNLSREKAIQALKEGGKL